ncbi:flagellar basal body-associated FliL family protein [Paracerasibacillus soli]|uniref:Uncharacterized protein n=1 Tax=Paracerasibacillus soli TaxID=480284 RepID=A0ABU5CP89_9BACI|nr:hypothetical protein [Virgibacillus soli]MDY0408168.1 hypothetical protein [Virgibacillus soli]
MSKLMKVMLTSIIIIIFIGGIAAVIYFNFMSDKNKSDKQSIDDIVEYSFETPEITTNYPGRW